MNQHVRPRLQRVLDRVVVPELTRSEVVQRLQHELDGLNYRRVEITEALTKLALTLEAP